MATTVQLRNVEVADLPFFFEHQRDSEAVAMVGFKSRDLDAFEKHWAKILADETSLKRTIVVDGQVAGHLASFIRDDVREVGYWLDRSYWGRGIATEALTAFLALELRRPLYAGVANHNLASIRVLEKCGFTVSDSGNQASTPAADADVLLTLGL
jgi:RimJ/RimL family protein N-acetyltransferase